MSDPTPYLSVVATSRNDDHGGDLLRRMQTFGMPLVPSALALWAISFIDREFVAYYNGRGEVGIYSAAIKVASVITRHGSLTSPFCWHWATIRRNTASKTSSPRRSRMRVSDE